MRRRRFIQVILVGILVTFPWLPRVELSYVVNAIRAGEYALIAVSLVLLTGWVGQISLGHGTFVGLGAFTTGLLVRQLGIPFPINLPIVAAVTAGVASLLGLVALRVRGLYLAVATLIFAWMADAYLFTAPWLIGQGGSSSIEGQTIGRPGTVTAFDLSDKRVFYLVMLAAVAATLYAVVNLRDSKTGRAFFAIRGSEVAAVSLGIDITRYKLMAFAISGGIAGIAGNLTMTGQRTASPVSFQFTVSLVYLSIAVVGGISSLPGAVAASLLFAGIYELFFQVDFLEGYFEIVTMGLLLAVLLVYPVGLGGLGPLFRRQLMRFLKGIGAARIKTSRRPRTRPRLPLSIPSVLRTPKLLRNRSSLQSRKLDFSKLQRLTRADASPGLAQDSETHLIEWRKVDVTGFSLSTSRQEREPVLEARNVTVRFGGLTAVDDVSVEVREHEIVGLIGPNGAGKTTTFNAISGLNSPSSGTVRIFGQDATRLPVHLRAQMGVGRTFQLIQLFPQLSVFDNLLVATHMHNQTGVVSHLLWSDRAVKAERDSRQSVRQIVSLLGLEDVADRRVAGLPFGLLRQVEIARALVTRAPFMMLDEPASGLDNNETEELSRLLYFIRAELGVSILLIEHDVKMVTSVSDYMYVINRGRPLAEGTPAEIQRNPEVISAYLGEAEVEMEPAV